MVVREWEIREAITVGMVSDLYDKPAVKGEKNGIWFGYRILWITGNVAKVSHLTTFKVY
jgi:hypothetical protein